MSAQVIADGAGDVDMKLIHAGPEQTSGASSSFDTDPNITETPEDMSVYNEHEGKTQ